jgi:hypothetical protein
MGRTRERRREAEEGDDELTANEGVARRRKERVTVVDTSESRRLVESHPPLRSFFRLARGIFHPNRVVGRIQAGVGRFRWVWAGVETSRGLNELIFFSGPVFYPRPGAPQGLGFDPGHSRPKRTSP